MFAGERGLTRTFEPISCTFGSISYGIAGRVGRGALYLKLAFILNWDLLITAWEKLVLVLSNLIIHIYMRIPDDYDVGASTSYVALRSVSSSGHVARMRASPTSVTIVAGMVVLLTATSTYSAHQNDLLSSVTLKQGRKSPPDLCYDFKASVRKTRVLNHITASGRRHQAHASVDEFGLEASRSAGFLAVLQPSEPPFEKTFKDFWLADTAAAIFDAGSCIQASVQPFFNESICTVLPQRAAARRERSIADADVCIAHSLHRVMPLDDTFGLVASAAYLNARHIPDDSVPGDAEGKHNEIPGALETWEWVSDAEVVNVSERGVRFDATVRTTATYKLVRDDKKASPLCRSNAAAARGDGVETGDDSITEFSDAHRRRSGLYTAMLRSVRSVVVTTLRCTSEASLCAAADSTHERVVEVTTETSLSPPKAHDLPIMSEPPSMAACVDLRMENTTRAKSATSRPHEAAPAVSAGFDAVEWDRATGRQFPPTDGAEIREAGAAAPAPLDSSGEPDAGTWSAALIGDGGSWLAPHAALLSTVGDVTAVRAINEQHRSLGWLASQESGYFGGRPLMALQRALGTKGVGVNAPALDASPHLIELDALAGGRPPPSRFDAREQWPHCADVIGHVPSQGGCGSCWAVGAAAALSDRLCIASHGRFKLQLSSQAMLDCDSHDGGCEGGFLDNAWAFFVTHGVPAASCVPYAFCDNSLLPNCSLPAEVTAAPSVPPALPTLPVGSSPRLSSQPAAPPHSPPPPPPPLPSPPPPSPAACGSCVDGTPSRRFRTTNAYAAAPVGDVLAMQRELLAHGPFEVAYSVFSDFAHYRSGVYQRSSVAFPFPIGGHAVRLIGWGEEVTAQNETIPYWLCANSWSPAWGEEGFFRIRRGTNEAAIETTPAAGLPLVPLMKDEGDGGDDE